MVQGSPPSSPLSVLRRSCSFHMAVFSSLAGVTVFLVLLGVLVRQQTRMSPYQAVIVASRPSSNSIYRSERERMPELSEVYKTGVPHTLWQTCKSHEEIPALATQLFESWSSYNPTYDHVLLDDREIEDFVLQHYNQTVLDAFKDMPLGVMKADVFRYMAIYFHGGVYADMDTECKTPIEAWVKPGCQMVIAVQDNTYLCQWAFAGVAGHPVLKSVLDLVLHRMVHKTIPEDDNNYVFKVSGPGVFTEGVLNALNIPRKTKMKPLAGDKDLMEQHGVCIISRADMKKSLRNMYSSSNKWLQGGSWSGWLAAQDELKDSKSSPPER